MASHCVRKHADSAQSHDDCGGRLGLEMIPQQGAGVILESGVIGVGERLRDELLDSPHGNGIGAVDGIVSVVSFDSSSLLVPYLLRLQ
jgi:hypothetical protein